MITFVRYCGRFTQRTITEMGRMGIFLATALLYIFRPPLRGPQLIRRIHFIGTRSLLLIIFTGAFTGMVVAFQGHIALRRFGGEAFLGPGVGLSLIRELGPVLSAVDLHRLQAAIDDVYLDGLIERWIVDLVWATRRLDQVLIGASVRGSIALDRAVRAWALLHGRGYVIPEDVLALFAPVLGHRMVLSPGFLAEARGAPRDELLAILARQCLVIAPRPELPTAGERVPALENRELSRPS